MVEKLSWLRGEGYDPFRNLALEEALLGRVEPGECILYLWQNQQTVVIGRNQNPWKECRVSLLEEEGGRLARRLSGGGAVFHDLGNLNFTFLLRREDYDVPRQTRVILRGLQALGLQAEATGRNDITLEGRKCSGSAYWRGGDRCFHHGTLLLSADMAAMERYLTVSREKLQSKSVDSVRSRVANLRDFLPGLSLPELEKALLRAFGEVWGGEPQAFDMARLPAGEPEALREKYASWDWRFGRDIPFSDEAGARFPWGEARLQLQVEGGRVKAARLWSDALDTAFPLRAAQALEGLPFRREELAAALAALPSPTSREKEMAGDVASLLDRLF
jgi:lipoate-protein ligase A